VSTFDLILRRLRNAASAVFRQGGARFVLCWDHAGLSHYEIELAQGCLCRDHVFTKRHERVASIKSECFCERGLCIRQSADGASDRAKARAPFAHLLIRCAARKCVCNDDDNNEIRISVASRNRYILSGQSPIHRQRKITPHLNPVLVPIRPRSKLKAHSAGGEADNIRLRCWFFRYA
jgi:hypothetical protein